MSNIRAKMNVNLSKNTNKKWNKSNLPYYRVHFFREKKRIFVFFFLSNSRPKTDLHLTFFWHVWSNLQYVEPHSGRDGIHLFLKIGQFTPQNRPQMFLFPFKKWNSNVLESYLLTYICHFRNTCLGAKTSVGL